ncbi:MAG TPA: amino acid ABC transporter substrate-binding protein [Burkholderiales bacterium]|nr:amino acid ABC transporter substrate-binding protein [Burkholderiales bacterium]
MRLRLLLLALWVCAVPARGQQQAVVVGAVLPLSGQLADIAADYRKALLLWQEEANAAGGLLGRHVELRLLDDQSDSAADGGLYGRLIEEYHATLLLGPLGSAASLGAAAAAERARRVLVNATGASGAVTKAEYRYVFQVPAPLASYGLGPLELARELGVRHVLVLGRDDPVSREMAKATREAALKQGFAVGEPEAYGRDNEDFAPQILRARKAGAEAWIAFGLARDAAGMVKSFRRAKYAPRLFVAQGAADPEFIKLVGQDAEYAIGISAYERAAATPGNARFVQAFGKRWSAEPNGLAADGYAAGKVLEAAVGSAGSFDQEKLRVALAALETGTPLGPYKVDRDGAQVGTRPLLVQIDRGRREIILPEALATARPRLPYPAWSERKPIR